MVEEPVIEGIVNPQGTKAILPESYFRYQTASGIPIAYSDTATVPRAPTGSNYYYGMKKDTWAFYRKDTGSPGDPWWEHEEKYGKPDDAIRKKLKAEEKSGQEEFAAQQKRIQEYGKKDFGGTFTPSMLALASAPKGTNVQSIFAERKQEKREFELKKNMLESSNTWSSVDDYSKKYAETSMFGFIKPQKEIYIATKETDLPRQSGAATPPRKSKYFWTDLPNNPFLNPKYPTTPISKETPEGYGYRTFPFYQKTRDISSKLQKIAEGSIDKVPYVPGRVKEFEKGFTSVFTGLPEFVGSGITGWEAFSKSPKKASTMFIGGVSKIGTDLWGYAKEKPYRSAGMGLGLFALGRIGGKQQKPFATKKPYIVKEVTGFKTIGEINVKKNIFDFSKFTQKVNPKFKTSIKQFTSKPDVINIEKTPFSVEFIRKIKTGKFERVEAGKGIIKFKKGNLIQGDFGGTKRLPDSPESIINIRNYPKIGKIRKVSPMDTIDLNVTKWTLQSSFKKGNKLSGLFTGKIKQKYDMNIFKEPDIINVKKITHPKRLYSGNKRLKSAGLKAEFKSRSMFKINKVKNKIKQKTRAFGNYKKPQFSNPFKRKLKIPTELEFKLSKLKQPSIFHKPKRDFNKFLKNERGTASFMQKSKKSSVTVSRRKVTVLDRPPVLSSLQNLRVSAVPIPGVELLSKLELGAVRLAKMPITASIKPKIKPQTTKVNELFTSQKIRIGLNIISGTRSEHRIVKKEKTFIKINPTTKSTTKLVVKSIPQTYPRISLNLKHIPKTRSKTRTKQKVRPLQVTKTQYIPKPPKVPKPRYKSKSMFPKFKFKKTKGTHKFKEITDVMLPSQMFRSWKK